ncbi:MAG: hypothetical protein R3F59_01175 [Myxococcota bacterium]
MGRTGWVLAALPLLGGCDVVEQVLSLKPPKGELARVDLVKNPSVDQLLGYGCDQLFGSLTCGSVGLSAPPRKQLQFSFDLVFDLHNPNDSVPVPLVDLLLGFTVFDGANLGAACLSFCDPNDEGCVATSLAVDACTGDAQTVDDPGDLVPTIDDLFALAEDVAAGDLENTAWRTIPARSDLEAHVQFDLDIDTMLGLADDLLFAAVDDALSGRKVQLDIPYTADGTLFFDVPELGRKGVGFGPFADDWILEP